MRYHLLGLLLAILGAQKLRAEAVGVCRVCKCLDSGVVNCRGLDLNSCFEREAWRDVAGPEATFTEIDLRDNRIGHVTAFPALNITKLTLANNSIVKIDDKAFRNLTRLTDLDLSDNELVSGNLMPRIFQGPFNAEYYEPLPIRNLNLSGNELHSLNALLFEHLPKIVSLSLKRNPFGMLDKATVIAISSLPELESLDLSFAQLKELPTGFLHSVKNLKELNLMGNFLREVPNEVLFESRNLMFLNLNDNPIKVISTERPFPEMPSLATLHISHMPELRRIEGSSMHGLTGLKYLDCKGNGNLEFISPLAFARNESDTNRPNVTELDLSDNTLRYLNRTFLNMDMMKHINLLGNNWSCDCCNQWMISELVPILLRTKSSVNDLKCLEPSAMKGLHFLYLYRRNYKMRCLDYYGNHPENDSVILVTVFSIIVGVLVLGLIIVWKSRISACRRGSRVDYSRALYRRAQTEENVNFKLFVI